jgi:hypothetical protein
MDYLSDEQIKILLVSKESPTICDTIMQYDFDGMCLDKFIKNSSDFSYFSLCLTLFCNYVTQNKIGNIITSKLGQDELKVLNSSLNILSDGDENYLLAEQYMDEMRSLLNNESQDIFESNTPEEDRDDWE